MWSGDLKEGEGLQHMGLTIVNGRVAGRFYWGEERRHKCWEMAGCLFLAGKRKEKRGVDCGC